MSMIQPLNMEQKGLKPILPHRIYINTKSKYKKFIVKHPTSFQILEVEILDSVKKSPKEKRFLRRAFLRLGKASKSIRSLYLKNCPCCRFLKAHFLQKCIQYFSHVRNLALPFLPKNAESVEEMIEWIRQGKRLTALDCSPCKLWAEVSDPERLASLREKSLRILRKTRLIKLKSTLEKKKEKLSNHYSIPTLRDLSLIEFSDSTKAVRVLNLEIAPLKQLSSLCINKLIHLKTCNFILSSILDPKKILSLGLSISREDQELSKSLKIFEQSIKQFSCLEKVHLDLQLILQNQVQIIQILTPLQRNPIRYLDLRIGLSVPDQISLMAKSLAFMPNLAVFKLQLKEFKQDFNSDWLNQVRDFYESLSNLKLLTVLSLIFYWKGSAQFRDMISTLSQSLSKMPSLQNLTISGLQGYYQVEAGDLVKALQPKIDTLRELRFHLEDQGFQAMDTLSFIALLSKMKFLEVLTLQKWNLDSEFHGHTERLLKALIQLKRLKSLNLLYLTGEISRDLFLILLGEIISNRGFETLNFFSSIRLTGNLMATRLLNIRSILMKNPNLKQIDMIYNKDSMFENLKDLNTWQDR